jgi:4,5-dihydroxyphthalate decarboxylase
MSKPHLTIALGHYDHVTDLVTGRIGVNGATVNCVQFDRPAEIHFRFILHKDFDVAEMSLGKHASMISQGVHDFVALPVFTSRLPRHSSIYVRKDAGLRTPADLAGKRVGVPEWAQTAAVYLRGMIAHTYGVDLRSIDWVQAGRIEKVDLRLPDGVRVASAPDKNLSDMLVAGELDAVFAAHPPEAFRAGHPNVARLFDNALAAEQDYVKTTGIFPIMHVVAVRKPVLEANPWLAMNLFTAFEQAKNNSLRRMFSVSAAVPVPWAYEHARAQTALFGKDIWPYGLEPNRKTLEAFLQFAFEQGVCHRLVQPEELFAPQTLKRFTT